MPYWIEPISRRQRGQDIERLSERELRQMMRTTTPPSCHVIYIELGSFEFESSKAQMASSLARFGRLFLGHSIRVSRLYFCPPLFLSGYASRVSEPLYAGSCKRLLFVLINVLLCRVVLWCGVRQERLSRISRWVQLFSRDWEVVVCFNRNKQ